MKEKGVSDIKLSHRQRKPKYKTGAVGVFYVTDSKEFELLTISFPELETLMNDLPSFEETKDWDKEKRDAVMHEYCSYDNTIEALTESIDDYNTKRRVCAELWEVNPEPKFYVLKFDLEYEWTYDSYTGESDFEVDFEYTSHVLKDEWENVDLYSKGTVLYSLNYETNNESVIVTGLREVIDEEPLYDGIYYVTEKDVNGIKEEVLIEMNDENWVSSPEEAHKRFNHYLHENDIVDDFGEFVDESYDLSI